MRAFRALARYWINMVALLAGLSACTTAGDTHDRKLLVGGIAALLVGFPAFAAEMRAA